MNKKRLFKQLNSLCKELQNRYDINNGGCCFVAATIAEQFEIYNIPFTVIKYDSEGLHYAIRVNDRIINRDNYFCREIVDEFYISSETLYLIYKNNNWNPYYNTKYNETVSNKIKSLFHENNRT